MNKPLLTIHDLRTHFFLDEGVVRAVNGVNLEISKGRTLAIVGESGCGKSVTAFSILRLVSEPGRIVSGQMLLHGDEGPLDLVQLPEDGKTIRHIRGKDIAMIFQEPMTSLSPVHTVGDQIMEAVLLHTDMNRTEAQAHTIRMLERVGIPDAGRRIKQYSHEMSGGMRQRVMIAMALSCRPTLLIADEPTTALDVTIQAQILALMRNLQEDMGMAILLITHDLGVVAAMAHEVAVMYMGRVVERAATPSLFEHPQHPYTQALLRSIPGMSPHRAKLDTISGSVPDALQQIAGCPFHPRCNDMVPGRCDQGESPGLEEVEPEHQVACILRHGEHGHG
jgi:peptide/nickel transport system ATP-binding protein